MLKFCLAGEYPLDVSKIGGGVAYVIYILGETFAERNDIDFHIVSPAKGIDGVKVEKRAGVTVHYVEAPVHRIVPNLLTQGPKLAPVLRDLKPDVVNSHHCITTEGAVLAGCKVVHTIHGIIHNEIKYCRGKNRWSTTLHSLRERKAVAEASAVLGVAKYGLDAYQKNIHSPTFLMNHPLEDIFFEVPPMSPSKSILYVGIICERKNLLALVKAVAKVKVKHPDVRLNVCGPVVQPAYMETIRSFIKECQLEENVNFAGLVDRRVLAGYLGESLCLALPSRQETSPVVICQALAAGRPVIASPVGGIPEMIDEGVTGFLVDSENQELLAARITELFDDSSKAKQMGDAAREIASLRYDRHKVAEHILEVCRTLVD